MKPITPQFSKVMPNFGKYFSRIFFAEGLFNLAKSLVKVAIIGIVSYVTIQGELPKLVSMLDAGLGTAVGFIASLAARLLLTAGILFLAISIPDYVFQRRQFMDSLKMSKQEVKEEYKQMEGDPLVKGRLRQRMRELLSQNMAVNVRRPTSSSRTRRISPSRFSGTARPCAPDGDRKGAGPARAPDKGNRAERRSANRGEPAARKGSLCGSRDW
jgi:flagellar biosynthesis protein FlhB